MYFNFCKFNSNSVHMKTVNIDSIKRSIYLSMLETVQV